MNKTSIQKIAADLEVSTTTISFIINGKADKYKISKATQKRVRDYIEKNNYQPSSLARSLTTGKSYTIGFLAPDIANPFYGQVGKHIEKRLFQAGYQVFLSSTEEDPEMELKMAQSMVQRQVDGIILAPASRRTLTFLRKSGTPTVTFDRKLPRSKVNFVGIDNYQASFGAINEFLSKNKCRNMLMISITPEVDTLKQRIAGCIDAFENQGLKYPKHLNLTVDYQNLEQSCYEEISRVLEQNHSIDSVYFTNNLTAFRGFYTFSKYHRSRLEKLKLISFDDLPFNEISHPVITGIEQPKEEIANSCSRLMLSLLNEKKDQVKKIILPVQVNWR
ncbi:MAG: LacI family DNA-binding transcriptional regulator [Planctomycetes bacterium]|nr:LacI family DNA-binding transcriptional regulator [Planctomycetota bacterium]